MTSVAQAFETFRSRLEISTTQGSSASNRQQRMRQQLKDSGLLVVDSFLTGAYARDTKTTPLRDVDMMIVLDEETKRLAPGAVLADVRGVLAPLYGEHRVTIDQRAVRVDFGIAVVDDVSDEVASFDVVPAVKHADGHYLIPDERVGLWLPTDPKRHAELATAANKAYDGKWKPLVKMIKKWNEFNGRPVFPSFLLETIALSVLTGEWTGDYPYELRMFFATASDQLADEWRDPAGVGADISEALDSEPEAMTIARQALADAEKAATKALAAERDGRTGDALQQWRALLGPWFPAS
jgi:hypothetical protein